MLLPESASEDRVVQFSINSQTGAIVTVASALLSDAPGYKSIKRAARVEWDEGKQLWVSTICTDGTVIEGPNYRKVVEQEEVYLNQLLREKGAAALDV